MKYFTLSLEQINGGMALILFNDEKDKHPIIAARSVAPSQWDEARVPLLKMLLTELANKIPTKTE